MVNYSINEFKSGLKVILGQDPCSIIDVDFVKPGKGQAFTRVRMKNLKTGRVWDRTFKSGDVLLGADIIEKDMDYIYYDGEFWVFMSKDALCEEYRADLLSLGECKYWLKELITYTITLWNNSPLFVTPPNFIELQVIE